MKPLQKHWNSKKHTLTMLRNLLRDEARLGRLTPGMEHALKRAIRMVRASREGK